MGSFAYVLTAGNILAYDVLDDGSLSPIGEIVTLSSGVNNVMCACGDTVFALSDPGDSNHDTYIDIFQADRASGQLIPRVQGYSLGDLGNANQCMAAIAPAREYNYLYISGDAGDENSVLFAFLYNKVTHLIGQLDQLPLISDMDPPQALQFDGSGTILYASMLQGGYSPVSFTIDPFGRSTLKDKVSVASAPQQYCLAVDPTQNFVYTGSMSLTNPEILGFRVVQGGFLPLKNVADHTRSPVSAMTMSSDGKYVFVSTTASPFTGAGANTIVSYEVNPLIGALTPINEQQDGLEVLSLAVTQDGKYLYAASFDYSAVYRYGIDKGKLSSGTVVATIGMSIDDFVLVNES
jgi:6-phosphogluconolactonase (cycloisomerase 2 family)